MGRSFITVNYNSTTDVASSVSVPWVFLPSVVSLYFMECAFAVVTYDGPFQAMLSFLLSYVRKP